MGYLISFKTSSEDNFVSKATLSATNPSVNSVHAISYCISSLPFSTPFGNRHFNKYYAVFDMSDTRRHQHISV